MTDLHQDHAVLLTAGPACYNTQLLSLDRPLRGSLRDTAMVLRAPARQIIDETLPALAKLRKEGVVRYVGFSGLPLDAFTYILDRCAKE